MKLLEANSIYEKTNCHAVAGGWMKSGCQKQTCNYCSLINRYPFWAGLIKRDPAAVVSIHVHPFFLSGRSHRQSAASRRAWNWDGKKGNLMVRPVKFRNQSILFHILVCLRDCHCHWCSLRFSHPPPARSSLRLRSILSFCPAIASDLCWMAVG